MDHRVHAVGDGLVARYGAGVEREARLLAAIAPRLPLPVPLPVTVEPGRMVQTRVPGRPLLALPRVARRAFAPTLLSFADAVHALDPGVEVPDDDTTLEDWLVEARATWAAVREMVPASVEDPLADPRDPPAPRVFIHGDLGAEHVFVDGGRITGVIDWGDAVIGDPDLDRGRLMRDFGSVGGERARRYAVCTALEDLAYGLETGREVYRANALEALAELSVSPKR